MGRWDLDNARHVSCALPAYPCARIVRTLVAPHNMHVRISSFLSTASKVGQKSTVSHPAVLDPCTTCATYVGHTCAGKDGWALDEYPTGKGSDMEPLLDAIVASVPAPSASPDAPFKMLVTMLEHDNYVGRIATGRVAEGIVREGDAVKLMPVDGSLEETGRVRCFLAVGDSQST